MRIVEAVDRFGQGVVVAVTALALGSGFGLIANYALASLYVFAKAPR